MAVFPTNTNYSAGVGIMLAHRLRRWPNITPTSAGTSNKEHVMLAQCHCLMPAK